MRLEPRLPPSACDRPPAAFASPARERRLGRARTALAVGRTSRPRVAGVRDRAAQRAQPAVRRRAGRTDPRDRARAAARRAFLDIRWLVSSGGEQGLLSVAFHPRYARTGASTSTTPIGTATRAWSSTGRTGRARPDRRAQLLFVDQPYPNHNGGLARLRARRAPLRRHGRRRLRRRPGEPRAEPPTRLGKLLRDRRRPAAARIRRSPPTGLRNPWRFSFDRANGDLYIGDVGQSAWEEIDFTRARPPGLENYGWDVYEGRASLRGQAAERPGGLVVPIAVYPLGGALLGHGRLRLPRPRVPARAAATSTATTAAGTVWSLGLRRAGERRAARAVPGLEGLSSFGEDARGELYRRSLENGTVYRLVELGARLDPARGGPDGPGGRETCATAPTCGGGGPAPPWPSAA